MLNKSADNMSIPGYNAEELSKFKNNIAWIYHATTKIKAKHRNQRVLSVLKVTPEMELKEEPPVFDGTILFRSSNGSNAVAQIIFLMKPKENDRIDTYRTGWIYEDNIVFFDTSLHQCDRGSNNYIPMNDRTYGFHLRLLSDAKRTLGEDYTLLNLLVTVNCRISKNHNYYPYDLASLITEPTDNSVAEPEVVSDKQLLEQEIIMFPSALISNSLDKLLSAMLYAIGLKVSPVWDIIRPMTFYGLADNAEINSLIDTKRPVLLCKPETSQFKDITSVWVPNRNMRPYQKTDKIGLAGIIVHCSPYFVYGQITYVYYGGYMFTESKKFSILPYSTFVLDGLIKRVALGNTLNLHSKILGEIEKKHNNVDTLLLISGVDENRLEIDAFEFDINDEKEFTAEIFNSNSRVENVIDKVDETTLLKNMLADMTGMMTEVLARLPVIDVPTNQEQSLNTFDASMDIKPFDERILGRATLNQRPKPFGMVSEVNTKYPNISNGELVRLFDNNIRLLNGRLGDIEDKNVALEKRLLMIEKKFYREGISLLD